jgi:hypothetical protein
MEPSQDHTTALRCAVQLKECIVARDGVGSDLEPQLLLMDKRSTTIGVMPLLMERFAAAYTMAQAIGLSDCHQAIHVVEGYEFDADPEALRHHAEHGEHGDLAAKFAAGDKRVLECVVVVSMYRDGACSAVRVPYTYRGRAVEWAAERWMGPEDGADGLIPEAMGAGFDAQRGRSVRALTMVELSMRLGVPILMPMPEPRPERNSPCPCGSGLKSKLCCWA